MTDLVHLVGGGALIGAGAAVLALANGRIAGISGVCQPPAVQMLGAIRSSVLTSETTRYERGDNPCCAARPPSPAPIATAQ